MAESNRIHTDLRGFIREMTARQERVTDRLVHQIDVNTAELQDVGLATRQHTQALARILDRLE